MKTDKIKVIINGSLTYQDKGSFSTVGDLIQMMTKDHPITRKGISWVAYNEAGIAIADSLLVKNFTELMILLCPKSGIDA